MRMPSNNLTLSWRSIQETPMRHDERAWRFYYRMALVFMVLLVLAGAIESRRWWGLVVVFGLGFTVWRAELPTWDELWASTKKRVDTGDTE
jgi:hypothetical protein